MAHEGPESSLRKRPEGIASEIPDQFAGLGRSSDRILSQHQRESALYRLERVKRRQPCQRRSPDGSAHDAAVALPFGVALGCKNRLKASVVACNEIEPPAQGAAKKQPLPLGKREPDVIK